MTPRPELYDSLDAHLDRNEQEEINADSGRAPAYRFIPLTQGYWALVDAEDYERIAKHKWCIHVREGRVYAIRNAAVPGDHRPRRTIFMHREIMHAARGEEFDHRVGIGLDNRKHNLRKCTHQQNCANQGARKNNKCGRKGVVARGNKWQASICFHGKKMHLGYFDSIELAAARYLEKAIELNGEFARN